MTVKSVCIYCGSRAGAMPAYAEAARRMGALLAEAGWRLVYGAGDVGLMGEVARAAQAAGGETFGVIPVHLLRREVGKTDLSTFVVTETMHERKKVMIMNADAVVVLPGGPGSLDELFEALTWRQLGLHDKPILVMNVDGYWDPLRALIERTVDQGFADASLADYLTWVDRPETAMAALRAALS
ncbi:TIGR00730 family Rossman fold protein [Ruegeria pomeroyi]|nr:TIGR00730 family Rossman fold protein [Ruegeria pomeroyi]MCE8516924.1 TIGR00730 family Rossman fold protein [Ruegeria pomeroyi]MCE8519544.1 TIGR00730 family Rossman fold protein [Ruegeria pomeroyi]MCE8524323.1 TIGR00730 family Rossman fold protein [Ruegeria pomeroyi]MCE8528227.1 TIGR00730 family Rossman fold protein [Ruegeria pomeroyi]